MNAPHESGRITLDDKYTLERGRAFMTGTQALVRLPMLQRRRDTARGINTAGYISGYRGSPIGGYDQALERARKHLEEHHIRFQPGVNEDLAATALWGTQQLGLFPGSNYDGVFGIWYGKGPGVDRCGDVFKHANAAGTARHGGVLVLAGDDHAAKSSTLAHQSEHILKACCIPVLNPANVQEILDYGLHGFAMSRYSGCWIGFKCVTDVIESGMSVDLDPARVQIAIPEGFALPPGGLNIRWPDGILEQEARLLDYKVYAAIAYARANRLDRMVWDTPPDSPPARFGIVATGKAFGDTLQALDDLGIDAQVARRIGLRLYKVAMPWPLEPQGARRFAEGLEEILVVEEKRQLVEYQLKEELYRWHPDERAPRVVGKFDDNGEWSQAEGQPAGTWLLPAHYELSPALIARAIAARLEKLGLDRTLGDRFRTRLAFLEQKRRALDAPHVVAARTPYFCSGCPHNTSTRIPAGSRALAGIGCHFMAQWMDRDTATFTHMGGEGAPWIGQAPFTATRHVFANMGDGTYFHSGLMAIRAAVAAGVNMTYKILYNDAVAMTGGQHHDGPLDPAMISRQLAAEGVQPIIAVIDDKEPLPGGLEWAPGTELRRREELDAVQRSLRQAPGVSAIIYVQTCAAEKRRRRKRGTFPDPGVHVVINEQVCEGCGDCSAQSNCLSIEPIDTAFGRKRRINQSTCNKDYSCLNGFCPSLVTVEGGRPRKRAPAAGAHAEYPILPDPVPASLQSPFGVLVTGIGGTGVITIGQILAMAGHIEGCAVSVLDMSGLAQKGGPVMSHVKIAATPDQIHASRLGTGSADLVIGCDLVVTASADALARMAAHRTRAAVNSAVIPTADFVRDPDWHLPAADLIDAIGATTHEFSAVDAGRIASALMGDSIATNMFMLGYVWQKGWIPLTEASLLAAIELNAVAVDFNRQSFQWGRRAACDPAQVESRLADPQTAESKTAPELDVIIETRVRFLAEYQDGAYADRYRRLVARVRTHEAQCAGAPGAALPLTEAVAHNYFRVLAIKDEYEVARLYADPRFAQQVARTFEGDYRIVFHLAPPLLARTDPVSGLPKKRRFGPWMMSAMRLLARLRFMRGTPVDPFGYRAERRAERALIGEYERLVDELLSHLSADSLALAVEIASVPDQIRGFGHVKQRNLATARERQARLLALLRSPAPARRAA